MFYEKYQRLCQQNGKAESTVCRELGLAPNSPKYWKEGQNPRPSTVKKVADYFGVDPSYFEQEELKLIPVHVITTEEQQILMMLNTLTEERKTLVLELIKELSK